MKFTAFIFSCLIGLFTVQPVFTVPGAPLPEKSCCGGGACGKEKKEAPCKNKGNAENPCTRCLTCPYCNQYLPQRSLAVHQQSQQITDNNEYKDTIYQNPDLSDYWQPPESMLFS